MCSVHKTEVQHWVGINDEEGLSAIIEQSAESGRSSPDTVIPTDTMDSKKSGKSVELEQAYKKDCLETLENVCQTESSKSTKSTPESTPKHSTSSQSQPAMTAPNHQKQVKIDVESVPRETDALVTQNPDTSLIGWKKC